MEMPFFPEIRPNLAAPFEMGNSVKNQRFIAPA